MILSDLKEYDTVVLYGMGFNGKSVLSRIKNFTNNIICWDKKEIQCNGYKILKPPIDFNNIDNYGKYIIIITPTIPLYATEMLDNIPIECNAVLLSSFDEYKNGFQTGSDGVVFRKGYCPCCENDINFKDVTQVFNLKGIGSVEISDFACENCDSDSRQRGTIDALNTFFPDWRNKTIHESSPTNNRIKYMKSLTGGRYSYSYFFNDLPLGSYKDEARCENLEKLTFEDESINFIITTDVFEHINSPLLAFKEIGRVLKKGGAHIFTVPFYKAIKTEFRVKERNGVLHHLKKPIYHGDPISDEGSLVTVDWGYDIGKYIWESCGMETLEYKCYKPFCVNRFDEGQTVLICAKH